MSKIKHLGAFILIGCTLVILLFAGKLLNGIIRLKADNTTEPGYYRQWLEEKRSADGTIPKWMFAKWSAADRSNLTRRGTGKIFDTIIELGPKNIGGRTRALWIDPRNDLIMLAGSVSGGLWRSENGGASWRAINDQETTLSVTCITSNPFNPDIVYYGTGESRGNSENVSGNGIYKSTDGGKTFNVLPSTSGKTGFDIIWKVVHSVSDSNTIYVGTDAQGLFRSIDAGNSWTQVSTSGSKKVTEVLALPNNRVIFTTQGSTVWASDSAGKVGTFKLITFPTPPTSWTRIQMANCRKFPNVCYAVFEGYDASAYNDTPARFYKSSDYGHTWIRRASPTKAGSGQQGYCVDIGAHPTDSNSVIVGMVYLTQTTNGGKSWSLKKTGHTDHHGFASFYTNTTDFLICSDGGLYQHKWAGNATPVTLNNGYNVTQFYAGNFGLSGMVSISGAQDNGTQVSTGKLATKQFYGADGAYAHVGLQDGTVAYLSTQNEGIRRIDGFDATTAPSFSTAISDSRFALDGVDFINAYAINPADQDQLYYRTNRYVYRTQDGGSSWNILSKVKSGIKALGCSNDVNPVLYFGGISGQLYKMENAKDAATGTEVSYNNNVPFAVTSDLVKGITVHPKNKYTVYLAFSNYNNQPRVWKVTGLDGANPEFKNISGNLPLGLPVNSIAVDPLDPDKNFFAGTDFGLYYSTDSGSSWQKETRIPNAPVFEVKMRQDRGLFVYTHGRGMWYLALANSLKTKSLNTNSGIRLYPNPASEILNIDVSKSIKNGRFILFDVNAKTILNSNLVAGNNSILVRDLKEGYYFLEINLDGEKHVSKILIKH